MENEPAITSDIKQITASIGGELVGLEFRMKTPGSFERKVKADMEQKGVGEKTSIAGLYDVIRYTNMSTPESLTKNYLDTVEKLKEKGYTLNKVKNTWTNPKSSYKGINAVFLAPNGEPFELQFHTKESFGLKQGPLHKLYEEYRLPSTSVDRAAELERQMLYLSAGLQVPKDIDKIK